MARLIFVMLISATLLTACQKQQVDINDTALFAGLSTVSEDARKALPGYTIRFPEDHKSHPEFAIEWWYLTANLFDDEGNQYPIQWTLFRFLGDRQATPWANRQQFMAHAKLHTFQEAWFEERFARGGVGNAAVSSSPFSAYLDDWHWLSDDADLFPATLRFTLNGKVSADLRLTSDADYVLHGQQGFSKKLRHTDQASYYYSQPFIQAVGTVSIAGKTIPVSGNAWFDHEWSSQYLDDETSGWDWFSMHLDNGDKIMLFNMRHRYQVDFWTGTLVKANGLVIPLLEEQIKAKILNRSEVMGKSLPLNWQIDIPSHAIELTISPFKQEQWNPGLFAYYEGAIAFTGSHNGHGFIELTGY